jgi:hypothetical protein
MTIGHLDFLEHVAPAPPTFVTALGPFGAGGAWGPVNVMMPSGGSYHIAIFPTDTTRFACTDVVISHLDSRGIPTYQDFYGGVLCGNGLAGLQGNCNAAVIRGNIYGNSLQISGTLAASAYLNTVIPGHAFTATGINLNMYATPFALSDPQPKVTAAAADVNSFLQLTPQSQLAIINAAVVNFGTTLGPFPLLAYSGPAQIDIEQEGVAAGANMLLTLNGFTVGGGAANVISPRRYRPLPNGTTQLFPVNLQSLLYTYSVVNSDGAQNSTVTMTVAAGKAA